GDAGDIQFTAASILGEKRQLTSDRVSIDVRQLALRGNPKTDDFEIYYTTDGSMPTRASERYTGAFTVALETCVKAAVYRCGDAEPLLVMEETFGADEGMYWAGTGTGAVDENICLAADAVLSGDAMTLMPYGYEERFVNFNGKPGSVEYTLTAPEAGDYYVAVCYNNGSGEPGNCKEVEVSVNGISLGMQPFFHNGPRTTFWAFHMLKASLTQGENKIRFISSEQAGPNLKQLIFWRASDVFLSTDALGEHTLAEYPSAFDDKAIDVGSGGSVSWSVSGKPAGRYSLYFWYSTPRGGLREVSGLVNGTPVAVWSGQKVSPDYGSSWGYCKTEISIAPGTNLLTVHAPSGGTLIGGMVLQPVKEYPAVATAVDSSCVKAVRLSSENDAPALTGIDDTSDAACWSLISDSDGLLYLVNRAGGTLLTFDGTVLALSDGETDGNAQWQRAGEAEHYDYLVHVATGKILVVKDDGTLDMDLRENYDDSDMITNRAFWRFSTESTGN
ncbi:MAG: chitobiase/beta-hexosaminidase C-terminal domain-containing protein, partial [Clostridia bacterium]|nr:chitobiase/beta-hexosaminidase C-terminal domain-containing protein [Clostridia bacterium]